MSKIPDRTFKLNFGDLGFAMIEVCGVKVRIVTLDSEGENTTGGVFLDGTNDPAVIIERAKNPELDPHRESRRLLSKALEGVTPDEWNDSDKTKLPESWSFEQIVGN